MKRDCFYQLTVTKLKPDGTFYFPKKSEKWFLGYFDWPEVLKHVEEWYERGADAVEMKMITEEEFNKKP